MDYYEKVIVNYNSKKQFGFYIGETNKTYLIKMPDSWFPEDKEIVGCILEFNKDNSTLNKM